MLYMYMWGKHLDSRRPKKDSNKAEKEKEIESRFGLVLMFEDLDTH